MEISAQKIRSRDDKLLEYCKGKKVLHIWACDSPYTMEKFNWEMGDFLYRKRKTTFKTDSFFPQKNSGRFYFFNPNSSFSFNKSTSF